MGKGSSTPSTGSFTSFPFLILDLFFFSVFLRYFLPGKKILGNKEKKTNFYKIKKKKVKPPINDGETQRLQ